MNIIVFIDYSSSCLGKIRSLSCAHARGAYIRIYEVSVKFLTRGIYNIVHSNVYVYTKQRGGGAICARIEAHAEMGFRLVKMLIS